MITIKKIISKPIRAKFPLLMEYNGHYGPALGTIAYFLDAKTAVVIVPSKKYPDVMDDIPVKDIRLSDWRVLSPAEKVILKNK